MTVIENIVQYIREMNSRQLDQSVISEIKYILTDILGCIVAGSDSEQVRLAMKVNKEYFGRNTSTIIASKGEMADARNAAMINSMAAHALDFDDYNTDLKGQSSAVIVPIVMSLGEKYNSPVQELMKAIYIGLSVDSVIGRVLFDHSYSKGWSSTSALGVLGATVAAGLLAGLPDDKLIHALGIAVDESSGFKINYGTYAKDLCVGHTAYKAIYAAEMAGAGLTANKEAMEGKKGFIETSMRDIERTKSIVSAFKEELAGDSPARVTFKPYPTSRGNHSALDCVLDIIKNNEIDHRCINKIICHVQNTVYDVDHYPFPHNTYEGKFSVRYCIAMLIINGRLSTEDFMGHEITDSAVIGLMNKIDVLIDPGFTNSFYGSEVDILLNNGTIYSRRCNFAKGSFENPMLKEELYLKFNYNIKKNLGTGKTDKILDMVENLENCSSIKPLIRLLS